MRATTATDAPCRVIIVVAVTAPSVSAMPRNIEAAIDTDWDSHETVREPHGGPFPGEHARYMLRSAVRVLDRTGDAP